MICKKCRKHKHYKCKNGAWKLGTHCTCQHRVPVAGGYALFLANKYNLPTPTGGWPNNDKIIDDSPFGHILSIELKSE